MKKICDGIAGGNEKLQNTGEMKKGAMLQFFLSLVIAVVQYYQSEKLNKISAENTEKERRIALFDKRYEIYDLFTRFHRICIDMLEKFKDKRYSDLTNEERKDSLKKAICHDYSNIEGILTENDFNDVAGTNFQEKNKLNQRYVALNGKFARDSLMKLNMAKFCFSESISKIIEDFAKTLLIDAFRESESENDEERSEEDNYLAAEFFAKLKKVLMKIDADNVIKNMEKEIGIF